MTDNRADDALRLLGSANPISVAELEAKEKDGEREATRERAIALARSRETADARMPSTGRGRRLPVGVRRDSATRVGGALLGVAVLAALVFVALGSNGGGGHPTFASAAVRVAEANPRLLVTEPGWRVTRADEFTADAGDMVFSDGTHELELNWYPAREYQSYFRDRTGVDPTPTWLTLLGRRSRTVQYGHRPDYATMLPPQGPTFAEVRGDLGSRAAYLRAVRSLRPTDVDTWLAAMPASVVLPTDRRAAVDEMLKGIPVPPGLNLERLRSSNAVLDRYQLGAEVTGAVACAWLDRYTAARARGDTAAAEQAVRAMATSRRWRILHQMTRGGAWSGVVWQYAAAMAAGRHLYRHDYSQGLGCNRF